MVVFLCLKVKFQIQPIIFNRMSIPLMRVPRISILKSPIRRPTWMLRKNTLLFSWGKRHVWSLPSGAHCHRAGVQDTGWHTLIPLGPCEGFTLLLSADDLPAFTPGHFFPGLAPTACLRLLPQCNSSFKCPSPLPTSLPPLFFLPAPVHHSTTGSFPPSRETFLGPYYCNVIFPSWERKSHAQ